MISGNKTNIIIDTKNLWSSSLSSYASSSVTVTVATLITKLLRNSRKSAQQKILLLKEYDYHKSTKPIYGAAAVLNQLQICCSATHNIAMLVEMLGCGLPFVGWRVKPDPGDWHPLRVQRFISILKSIVWRVGVTKMAR